MNILELKVRFPDDMAFMDFFIKEVYSGVVVCPKCGSKETRSKDSRKFRCQKCGRKFSILKGTLLDSSKLSLDKWLYAISKVALNSRKGISSCELARDLGIRQKTAWDILTKIRMQMARLTEKMDQLKYIIEADEVYLGGKPRKANCKWINQYEKPKTPVVTFVERPSKGRPGKVRAFAAEVGENGKHKIAAAVKTGFSECIDPMAEIHTDQSPLYVHLEKSGFIHNTVPHYRHYVAPGGHIHINTAESFHAMPRRMHHGVYHQWKHTQRYVDEAVFRWNHRDKANKEDAIQIILDLIVG